MARCCRLHVFLLVMAFLCAADAGASTDKHSKKHKNNASIAQSAKTETAVSGGQTVAAPQTESKADASSAGSGNSAETPAVALEEIRVLALSTNEKYAVIQLPNKKMLPLHRGETIPGTQAVVTDVLPEKLVLEEVSTEEKTKQVVWITKGAADKPGKIQRFTSNAEKTLSASPPLKTTVSTSAEHRK